MPHDMIAAKKEEFEKAAREEFEGDPHSQALREYIKNHGEAAQTLAKNIRAYVSGENSITVDAIEQCKRDILRLGQVSHVIKTMPASDTEYRKHVANQMRDLLEAATADYHTILNWTRFGGERRL